MVTAPFTKPQIKALKKICDSEWLLLEYGTGTGKSRIIVETCRILVRTGEVPIIVVVPNSLLEQTLEEFIMWAGGKWTASNVQVLDRTKTIEQRRYAIKRGQSNIYLISTEALSYPAIREAMNYRRWAAALVDEASRYRNYSKRTLTLNVLGKAANRYAFTGKLLVNTPADVFYVMNFLKKGIFDTLNRQSFITQYCIIGGYMGNAPIDFRPDTLKQFQAIMKANSITAQLSDSRKLPPRELRVYRTDFVPLQRKAYKQMRDELKLDIERVGESEFKSRVKTYATRLQRLQEIGAGFARNLDGDVVMLPSPKTKELIEIIRERPTTPTVLWYWWNPERDRIIYELKKAKIPFVLFGETGARTKFLKGEVTVFLTQLVKGGYGLNLPNVERMIYHSLPWDLDVMYQSLERNRRLTTPMINHLGGAMLHEVIMLIMRDSVDDYVLDKIKQKVGISSKMSRSDALDLLRNS